MIDTLRLVFMLGGVRWFRGWQLWRLNRSVVRDVLLIEALALAAIAYGLWTAPFHPEDLVVFAALTGCGVVSVEAWRRKGVPTSRKDQTSKDFLTAWVLPMVLLLPPLFAAVGTIPLYVLSQIRVKRLQPFKQVFNAAVIGLSGFVGALTYRLLTGIEGVPSLEQLVGSVSGVLAALFAMALTTFLNVAMVTVILRKVIPGSRWRQYVIQGDRLAIDFAELGMALLVALCWVAQPFLVLAALPPLLLLQQTLLTTELQEAARTDTKTQLANPAYWREVATREVARASRGGVPLALLVIDIDHFKQVNDTHGHLVGDQALAAVAATLKGSVRPRDLVGRFGGEEFVVLLPGVNESAAQRAGERIRKRVEGLSIPVTGRDEPLRVTVSVGIALLGSSAPHLDLLIGQADTALYAAKARGRNNVRLAIMDADQASTSPQS